MPNILESPSDDASESVHVALVKQCADEIVFACVGGLGFRAIQAKRAGLAFADVTLSVLLDGASKESNSCSTTARLLLMLLAW